MREVTKRVPSLREAARPVCNHAAGLGVQKRSVPKYSGRCHVGLAWEYADVVTNEHFHDTARVLNNAPWPPPRLNLPRCSHPHTLSTSFCTMFSFRRWSLLALFAFAASAFAKSSTGDSVLVVLDPTLDKANYSIFFDGLKKNGYELTFRAPKDVAPLVLQDGVANFAHVIVFAPDTKSEYASGPFVAVPRVPVVLTHVCNSVCLRHYPPVARRAAHEGHEPHPCALGEQADPADEPGTRVRADTPTTGYTADVALPGARYPTDCHPNSAA